MRLESRFSGDLTRARRSKFHGSGSRLPSLKNSRSGKEERVSTSGTCPRSPSLFPAPPLPAEGAAVPCRGCSVADGELSQRFFPLLFYLRPGSTLDAPNCRNVAPTGETHSISLQRPCRWKAGTMGADGCARPTLSGPGLDSALPGRHRPKSQRLWVRVG